MSSDSTEVPQVKRRALIEFTSDDPGEIPNVLPLAGSYEADEALRSRIKRAFAAG